MTNGNRLFINALTLAATLVLASGCGSGGSATSINPASGSNASPPSGDAAVGTASLSWTAPTYNTNGSVLTDLDGYRIYWGTDPGQYPNSVTIENESITVYVLQNLPAGTYEFVATSFNEAGVESDYSNPVTREVR